MRMWPRALIVSFVSCLMATASAAQTPSGETGQRSGQLPGAGAGAATGEFERTVAEGLTAFRTGQYSEARALFERAHTLQPSARTWRALGLTAVEQERYTQAQQELETSLADTRQPLTAEQRVEIEQMLKWMRSTLSLMQLRVEPAQAEVSVDGTPTTATRFVLKPGKHEFGARAEGYKPSMQSLQLSAGQNALLELVLERAVLAPALTAPDHVSDSANPYGIAPPSTRPQPHSSPSLLERWWFWTAVGVVVAGGTVAAIALSSSGHPAPVGTQFNVLSAGSH